MKAQYTMLAPAGAIWPVRRFARVRAPFEMLENPTEQARTNGQGRKP